MKRDVAIVMLVILFSICTVLTLFQHMLQKYMPPNPSNTPLTTFKSGSIFMNKTGGPIVVDGDGSSKEEWAESESSPLPLGQPNASIPWMFFRPRLAGFNNQLQEVVAAIALANVLKWGVVLPLFGEQITWDHNIMDRIYPYEDYFDPSVLSKLVPVISTAVWGRQCNRTLDLDISHTTCSRKEKRELTNPQYDSRLGIRVKSAEQEDNWKTLLAHGPTMPTCFGINWPRCFTKPILRFKSKFGTPKWVLAFETSPAFQKVYRTLVPAKYILSRAKAVVADAGRYLAIHIRIGDFNKWCKQTGVYDYPQHHSFLVLVSTLPIHISIAANIHLHPHLCLRHSLGGAAFKCPSLSSMFNDTLTISRQYDLWKIFISCDPRYIQNVVQQFTMWGREANATFSFFTLPASFENFRPDVKSIAEQTISSHAEVFVGNSYSTWTHTVHYLRRLRNQSCGTSHMWMRAQNFVCV